jgi:hypothetical protein
VTTNSRADLTADEIAGLVARGHHIRALHLQAWGKHVMQTLTSLWRRPGRLTSAAPLRSR